MRDDDAFETLLAQACDAVGLRDADRVHVRDLLGRPSSAWPGCCGSGCRPCAQDLAEAALRVRAWLCAPLGAGVPER